MPAKDALFITVTKEDLLKIAKEAVTADDMMKRSDMIFEAIVDLVILKNHDYGDAWQRYGIYTPLIRINDKILRIATLSSGQQALVADEKIEDTLKDIIGYALLALLKLSVIHTGDDKPDGEWTQLGMKI